MSVALLVDPPVGNVAASGGILTHQLANAGSTRLAFKVKSSNNSDYRLKPVFGFIEPGGATPLLITRLKGAPKTDKLVVQFKEAASDARDASTVFKSGILPDGEIIVPLIAE